MGGVLSNGGQWYLGVADDQREGAATACYLAALIYGLYLVLCGLRIYWASKRVKTGQLHDEPDV